MDGWIVPFYFEGSTRLSDASPKEAKSQTAQPCGPNLMKLRPTSSPVVNEETALSAMVLVIDPLSALVSSHVSIFNEA